MKRVTRVSKFHISCHKILEVASLREVGIIIKCITKLHSQIYTSHRNSLVYIISYIMYI
jgi:hypothetical protein